MTTALALLILGLLTLVPAHASDWPAWRGGDLSGISPETGLVTSWSTGGENVLWRADYTGRSTPVVHGGRVFVTGRGGEGITQHERLSAFDAQTGELLWEHRLSTQLTTVPYNRAGWASPTVDPETGHVYAQGVAGPLVCYDADGNLIWERMLYEVDGRFSGYGGRTMSPLVDEDRLIVSVINSSWGPLGPPRHRYYAFDKRSGEVIWISTPGGMVYDRNTSGNSSIAVIGGQRLLIAPNADGHVYAVQSRTGVKVWGFELSKRGVNSSPLVVGDTVFVGHSEENIDQATLGRVVAIDATGTGDVTQSHEKWRREITMGFPSPLYYDGRLYVMDNSANLFALDADTGRTIWEHPVGTVGKSAPVWADGAIWITEVNGNVQVIRDTGESAEVLDEEHVDMPAGRYAEIYASPAVAYGRIYLATEEGLYALGSSERTFEVMDGGLPDLGEEARGSDRPSVALVVPGDKVVDLGDTVSYEVRLFNEVGRELSRTREATWSLAGIRGGIDGTGVLNVASDGGAMAGNVQASVDGLEASARLRAFGDLPYEEDFDDIDGRGRPWWIGSGRYAVVEAEGGGKMLEKPVADAGLLRSILFLGPNDFADYTIEAEIQGNQQGRRRTDAGLVNTGYILDLLGIKQELEIRTWSAEMRMAQQVPFEWEMGTWYMMKFSVSRDEDGALIRGKVWKKGEPEPADWTITARDPIPNQAGAPGVIGYSPAPVYWDNVVITPGS